jgi:hypothetical protein
MQIVEDESYDFAILMNLARPPLRIPKNRVIGLAWEPANFRNYRSMGEYVKRHVGAYIIGNPSVYGNHLGPAFFEHHSFMYDARPLSNEMVEGTPFHTLASSYNNPPERKHTMCMIATRKAMLPGHKKRHDLIKKILASDLDIDIWGRTIGALFKDDKRIKGGFGLHPQVYPNYMFDISIENCREGSYISEKLFNPLSHKTCPIYWGSSKVRNYCNDFFYDLPDNNDEVMDLLKKIHKDPQSYYSKKLPTIEKSSSFMRNYNYMDFCREYFLTGKLPKVIV